MKTDRELLELAAKAAGIGIVNCTCDHEKWPFKYIEGQGRRGHWNPLIDDGDALRLAVVLDMVVQRGSAHVLIHEGAPLFHANEHGSDKLAATRRAIVRAAAAIGEGME